MPLVTALSVITQTFARPEQVLSVLIYFNQAIFAPAKPE